VSEIDMSAVAVTARLKLVSQLRRLCLSLGTAKVDPQPASRREDAKRNERKPRKETK
jgi:hypothetical protein